ncbi:hypothetical protein [Kitasatospora purpeofusca]
MGGPRQGRDQDFPEIDKDRHSGDREYHERLEGYYGGGTAR